MQMRTALQNLGEKLRDEEIDELIREADIDTEGLCLLYEYFEIFLGF